MLLIFNYGLILGWTSINQNISLAPIILYFGAIFWTLGYDTVYGLQDISDDEVIGVKSTTIKFKNNLNLFIGGCYFASSMLILFVMASLQINYSFLFLLFFMTSLFYQMKIYSLKNPSACLKAFKLNNISGLFIFLGFLLQTIEI